MRSLPIIAFVAFVGPRSLMAQEVVPPRLLEESAPAYPEGGEGLVVVRLRLTIESDGTVSSAEELAREPADAPEAFAVVAQEYVRSLGFEPARRGEQPMRATIGFDVRFEPPPPPEPAVEPPAEEPVPQHQHEHEVAHQHTDVPEHAHGDIARHEHTMPEHRHREDGEELWADAPAFGATATLDFGTGERRDVAASDFDLELGALRRVPRRSAEELVTLAPGAVLSNHSGIGHAAGLYLRGFDAGEGQDYELLVSGIPLNEPSNAHAHGYADSHFLIPELVQSVRVLEGPFDARQGDFAVAGTVEYRLGVEERGVRLSGEYGSFDTWRTLLLYAPAGAEEGTFVGFDHREGDGFGPNRAHEATSAIGQYEHRSGHLRWAILGSTHSLDFDSAGVVREDDFEAGALPCDSDDQFFCVADPAQGGSASRHMIAGRVEWRGDDTAFTQQAWVGLRRSRFRENFTGALLDPTGDGLDEQYDTTTLGMRGSFRMRGELDDRDQHFEVGYLGRHDTGETRMWRLRLAGSDPYAVVFDEDLSITNLAAYALGELSPSDWFAVTAGIRLDSFQFAIVDHARPTMDRVGPRLPTEAIDASGFAVSPRGSVRLTMAEGLSWFTSVGMGTRSSDAIALSEGESAPFAEVFASETGFVYELEDGDVELEARALAYHTRISRDLVFDPARGRNVPVGPSHRFGALATARFRHGEWLDLLGSFTWAEAHQVSNDASFFDLTGGPRLPFVPRFVARLDAAVEREIAIGEEKLEVGGALGVTWVGPRPLPLATESEPTFELDAGVHAGWRFVELGFSIDNLFDIRNRASEFHYASDFDPADGSSSMREVRHFSAGTPRAFYLTLTLHSDMAWLTGDDE
jgi:iron complex outermembrane receptor protein